MIIYFKSVLRLAVTSSNTGDKAVAEPAASKASTSAWDVVGVLVAILVGLILLGFVVAFIRGAWDFAGQFNRRDQTQWNYSSTGGARSYAPRRMEYVPQQQPPGGYRCRVNGHPGWCR